jgi:type IV pilus assembly protein PilN
MIKINLLPFRAARIKEKIKLHVFIYIGFSSILILAMTWFYIDYTTKLKDLRKKQDKLEEELASYKDITTKIRALEQTKKDVDGKLKKIKELEKVKSGPVKLLDDIAVSVPKDRLWLTALKENKGTLVLEGTAMDNETVADFMNRLKGTESVKSVKLVRTKQKKITELNLNLKDFALTCKTYAYKEPPPKVKKKKGR